LGSADSEDVVQMDTENRMRGWGVVAFGRWGCGNAE